MGDTATSSGIGSPDCCHGKQRSSLSTAMPAAQGGGIGLPLLTKLKRDHPGIRLASWEFFQAFRIAAATGASGRSHTAPRTLLRHPAKGAPDPARRAEHEVAEPHRAVDPARMRGHPHWEARAVRSRTGFAQHGPAPFGIGWESPTCALLCDLLLNPNGSAHDEPDAAKDWESRGIDPEDLFKRGRTMRSHGPAAAAGLASLRWRSS